ncbi:MAG: JmjC domain-containing protein [Candidatus Neomarinimicrobiota bacterium]
MTIKTFNKNVLDRDLVSFFNNSKKPFIIRNIFNSEVNIDFLKNKFQKEKVLTLNKDSDKELLRLSTLIKEIEKGKKYRLRANTKLGNKIFNYIDTSIIKRLKGKQKNIFDYLLSYGKSSRQKTLFLSTKGCTFSKHAHVISGMIFQLSGTKTWHISKSRDDFFSIRYKSFLNPNPLYVTDKTPEEELKFTLNPGDFLYMPAYWFHYTTSNELSLSFSYFFTEKITYYLKYSPLMFIYQGLRNPYQAIRKAIEKEPEEHIFDRKDIINTCNKLKNPIKRTEAIEFFQKNDFS